MIISINYIFIPYISTYFIRILDLYIYIYIYNMYYIN